MVLPERPEEREPRDLPVLRVPPDRPEPREEQEQVDQPEGREIPAVLDQPEKPGQQGPMDQPEPRGPPEPEDRDPRGRPEPRDLMVPREEPDRPEEPEETVAGLVSFDQPQDGSSGLMRTDASGTLLRFDEKTDDETGTAWAGVMFARASINC